MSTMLRRRVAFGRTPGTPVRLLLTSRRTVDLCRVGSCLCRPS